MAKHQAPSKDTIKCPHCAVSLFDGPQVRHLGEDSAAIQWQLSQTHCPQCKRYSFRLAFIERGEGQANGTFTTKLIWPRVTGRPTIPVEVTDKSIAEDYNEACMVLGDSPKASAALSRRCLQHILHEKLGVKLRALDQEIQKVIDDKLVPAYLMSSLDAVRNIGNFSAHPQKSNSTGEIVPVEPNEAEWNLEVIELLFDFIYVQPALVAQRSAALNVKLADVNKPLLKAV
jgi:hypothetical protein